MGRLLKNELLKMRYSRMLWIVFAGTLAFVVLTGCAPADTLGWGGSRRDGALWVYEGLWDSGHDAFIACGGNLFYPGD